jgi:hypothetical protein
LTPRGRKPVSLSIKESSSQHKRNAAIIQMRLLSVLDLLSPLVSQCDNIPALVIKKTFSL